MNLSADTTPPVVLDLPNGTRLHLKSQVYLRDAKFILREIFEQQVYHHPGFELSPEDVVVDVGAHVGVFAHWAAPQLTRGRLVCVEPTANADCLEHSLAQNLLHQVTLHRVALGRPSCTLEMIEHRGVAAISRASAFRPALPLRLMLAWAEFRGRLAPPVRQTVPCWSLGELLAHEQLQEACLLKIDCEGSEHDILAHASDEDLRRFRRVMMEFHLFHPSHRLETLLQRFKQAGFQVHVRQSWFDYFFVRTGILWATRID